MMTPWKYLLPLLLFYGLGYGQMTLPQVDRSLDRAADNLTLASPDGFFFAQASFQLDLRYFYADDEGGPPGFFFTSPGRDWELSPRLTTRLDFFFGDRTLVHAKIRWDDGVHPGVGAIYNDHTEVRFDEVFLDYRFSRALNLKAGLFTPIIGNFLSRQNSWDMGTVNYPLLYENVTSVSDIFPPADAEGFANRRNIPDNKTVWISLIWAPLYTYGATLYGSRESWEYALNFTNAAPSSRGFVWNDFEFDYPTWSGRIAYRWGPELTLGVNLSKGPYFRPFEADRLPGTTTPDDYHQSFIGFDFQWAYRDWEVWAEIYLNEFEIPNVEDTADYLSYYVEVRRQLAPKWWLSARWNQEIYQKIQTVGGLTDWDNETIRLDLTLGHRFMRHAQFKLQYSYQRQDAPFQNGRNFLVTEFTLAL